MFRAPKTHGELKQLATAEEMGVRPRRAKGDIPTDRWDIPRSAERSWKRARRTQYREI